jgi:hypothetical protein
MSSNGRKTFVVLVVILQLDEEVIAAEDVLEARRGFEHGLLLTGEDQLRTRPPRRP